VLFGQLFEFEINHISSNGVLYQVPQGPKSPFLTFVLRTLETSFGEISKILPSPIMSVGV
jgi:hypothetical protein